MSNIKNNVLEGFDNAVTVFDHAVQLGKRKKINGASHLNDNASEWNRVEVIYRNG